MNVRKKGHSFEREVAALFRDLYPEARRGLGQPRGGKEAPDVDGTKFWVECKVGKRPNLPAALNQAVKDTDGRIPIAVCRVDRNPATVTLLLNDFLGLI